jgi:4Fe-4S iron-sulfur cluster binding domain/DR2241 stabilising domain
MNPDVRAFLARFDTEIVFGQVLVRRLEHGFELRHQADRAAANETLATLIGTELRAWAQSAAGGAFRPLKSAPNLRAGWRAVAADGAALDFLLHYLYPGAVADWFAAQSPHPPVTSYRQFTARQTGMYRITTMLTDDIAGAAIRACCHIDFCLKRRLWSVAGLEPEAAGQKTIIPCLEPCALMLEFARKVARLEQNTAPPAEEPAADVAESNFDAPSNPRRLRFSLEKQALAIKPAVY